MAERIQVNLGEEMIKLADHYAELMGTTRSALCSILISDGLLKYKDKLGYSTEKSYVETSPRICDRLRMLFDGWKASYDNMPSWKPDITIKDDYIYIDGQKLFPFEAVIDGACLDYECIQILYYDNCDTEKLNEAIIFIDWPANSDPKVIIQIKENETGTFTKA